VEKAASIRTCRVDPSVVEALAGMPPRNYMLVANLRNSEGLMAHFVQQIVTAAELLPGNVSLSIYESGSEDNTKAALQQLGEVLTSLGIRSEITTGGSLKRGEGQPRIAFLAELRNAALQPVYEAAEAGKGSLDSVVFANDVSCGPLPARLAGSRRPGSPPPTGPGLCAAPGCPASRPWPPAPAPAPHLPSQLPRAAAPWRLRSAQRATATSAQARVLTPSPT
jgi:hypothetical protein